MRDRGSPAVIGISFRPVALRPRLSTGLPLSLQGASVKASPMTVKYLYCVRPLKGRLCSCEGRHMLNCLGLETAKRPRSADFEPGNGS